MCDATSGVVGGWCEEEDGGDGSSDDGDDASSLWTKAYLYMQYSSSFIPQLHLQNVASSHLASPKVEKTITRTNRHVGHNVRRPLSFSLCAFQSTMFRGIETWLYSHEPVYM